MIILWTDALIFLLVIGLAIVGFFMSRNDNIKRPLSKLANNRVGMLSLVILLCFVLIGLIDSIHFKPENSNSNEVISALDHWAEHFRNNSEKSYSAPFATHGFSKEYLTNGNGAKVWDYRRLTYGGAHLQDPENDKTTDVLAKFFYGFLKGLGVSALLSVIVFLWARFKQFPITGNRVCVSIFWVLFGLIGCAYGVIELSKFYHVLGTDKVGEDVLYQTLKSIRTGLVIGTLTTLIMLPLAITFGILAGYFRGWVDDVIQYLYTTLNSIPSVLLIAASILMVQVYMANNEDAFTSLQVRADMRLLFLCLILGVTSWTGLCRLLRAETLKLREMEYVQAAKSLGVRRETILLQHILPNVMHIVLISIALDFSGLVLAEAVLSYINIGVDPTTYSWGNMINGARLEMAREPVVWWSLTAAFLFMFTLVLVANLFADAVRDAFDPRRVDHG